MAEDITTGLSRIRSLFVISRNSAFTYKGRAVDVRQVSRELGVRYVLEGSVRTVGSRVRITGQLIDAVTSSHLWADRFDGNLENVFELQDQLTANVVAAIEPNLRAAEIVRARRKPATNLQAYDLMLRTLPRLYALTRDGLEDAARLLRETIEIPPMRQPRPTSRRANGQRCRKTGPTEAIPLSPRWSNWLRPPWQWTPTTPRYCPRQASSRRCSVAT
jgi:adenylate cyclase